MWQCDDAFACSEAAGQPRSQRSHLRPIPCRVPGGTRPTDSAPLSHRPKPGVAAKIKQVRSRQVPGGRLSAAPAPPEPARRVGARPAVGSPPPSGCRVRWVRMSAWPREGAAVTLGPAYAPTPHASVKGCQPFPSEAHRSHAGPAYPEPPGVSAPRSPSHPEPCRWVTASALSARP